MNKILILYYFIRYDIDTQTNTFKSIVSIENLSSSISFIDFSTDNFYLVYKDNFEEITIIDLTNLKKVNTISVEFDIEWASNGLQIHEKTKGVLPFYQDDNRIIKMIRVGENTLIVSDEMGTVIIVMITDLLMN